MLYPHRTPVYAAVSIARSTRYSPKLLGLVASAKPRRRRDFPNRVVNVVSMWQDAGAQLGMKEQDVLGLLRQ
jgi:hypothetical protein